MNPNEEPLVSLPPELFRPVLEHLSDDRQTLLTCSKVNRILASEAQRLLFRSVLDLSVNRRTELFLQRVVLSHGHLALHIQALKLSLHIANKSFLRLLQAALITMVNLKHLSCSFNLPAGVTAAVLAGLRLRNVQLYSFEWISHQENIPGAMLEFLQSQHQLRYIHLKPRELGGHGNQNPMDDDATLHAGEVLCPSVKCFQGTTHIQDLLLPRNRRLETVIWNTRTFTDHHPFLSRFIIDNGLATIQHLSLKPQLHHVRADLNSIESVVQHLTGLRVLELRGYKLDLVEILLSWLPTVEVLILSECFNNIYMMWQQPARSDKDILDAQAIQLAFLVSPSVQYVDVQDDKDKNYRRVRRELGPGINCFEEYLPGRVVRKYWEQYTSVLHS